MNPIKKFLTRLLARWLFEWKQESFKRWGGKMKLTQEQCKEIDESREIDRDLLIKYWQDKINWLKEYTESGEKVPLFFALGFDREPSDKELEWGEKLAEKLDW